MPLVDNTHYVDSAGWTAVTAWAAAQTFAAGALRRQLAAPAVGSERVFVCIVGGAGHATTEPTWILTRGAKTTDNAATWQECTGLSGVNGDLANTPNWTTIKNTAIVLGQIIKRDNAASYQICTTAGTAGNGAEPSFSDTAGMTTADGAGALVWTSLGAVGNFTGGQAPHARMTNALATNWGAAGNTIFVKSSHAATQATNLSLAGASTNASPQRWLCHNGGAYPPLAANLTTGATEASSATGLSITALSIYCEGIEFIGSHSTTAPNLNTGNNGTQYYKNGKFTLSGSGSGQIITPTGSTPVGGKTTFDNTTFSFSHVNQYLNFHVGTVVWKNTPSALLGASVPTSLIQSDGTAGTAIIEIDGVDLSAAGAGKSIVGADNFSGKITIANCKLGASVTLAGTPTAPANEINFINCDSGAVNYHSEKYSYRGTLTTEETIVLTGGASDGTTPIAWKIVTTANAKFEQPFECPPIALWNDATGSPTTLTIQGIWGGGAVPNNDEIWVDVEYLGASGNPGASFVSDAKATVLTTAAGQDAGAGTWGGSTTKFALAVTFTPEMKGYIHARVKVGKLSSTFYVDPKITLS